MTAVWLAAVSVSTFVLGWVAGRLIEKWLAGRPGVEPPDDRPTLMNLGEFDHLEIHNGRVIGS